MKWRLCVLCAALAAISLFAQSGSSISGHVTDQTKLPVPNAEIVATAKEAGSQRRATTDGEGFFQIQGLPPMNYTVTAEFPGFKKASRVVKVDLASGARLDLVLAPADSRQVIDVVAEPPPLETTTGMVGRTLTAQEIDALPTSNRNVLELALTMPGVGGEVGADEGGVFQDVPTAGAGLSISGGRPSSVAILADGSNATSVGIGRATMSFSPDTIQEFKVITSTFSAQYGVTGSGIILKSTRGGSKDIRGNAFWYHRNPAIHSRQFNRPIPPAQRRNEVGMTLGGPLLIPKLYDGRKRNTYFFVAVEPRRWFDTVEIYDRFPTAAERQGDFRNMWVQPGQTRPLLYQQIQCLPSELDCQQLVPIHRPSGTAEYPLWSASDPDPSKRGRVIPKAYLDKTALMLLEGVPLPNIPYDSAGRNYLGARGVNGADNRWNLKIDHNFHKANRLTGRYTHIPNVADRYRVNPENYFFALASDRSTTKNLQLVDTHIFSSRVVNEFRGTYTFSDYSRVPPGDLATVNFTKDVFGLPNQTEWGYPQFNSGWGTYGMQGSALGQFVEHQFQFSDDLSMTLGRHTITVGSDWRFAQHNAKSSALRQVCCGEYNFAAAQTNSGNANTPGGTGGLQFASFLMGVPNGINLRGVIIPYYYRWRVGSAFFQDDFRLKRNLTLNLGVRWQYNSPRAEKFHRQATVDLDHPVELQNARGELSAYTFNYVYTGFGRSRYLEPVHKRTFEPRFGFAWQPGYEWAKRRGVVLRGGYGISHLPSTGRGRDPIPDFGTGSSGSWGYTRWSGAGRMPITQSLQPQYLISLGKNAPLVRVNPAVLEIPPNGILCDACPPRDQRLPSGALLLFSPTNNNPYVQTWSLTLEMPLPKAKSTILSVGYLGTKGTHLYSPLIPINNADPLLFEELLNEGGDPNELVPDPFGRVDNAGNVRNVNRRDLLRPFPTAGDINLAGVTNSNSIYNAGTVSVEKRYQRGLGFRFNYTWGKSLDTSSDSSLAGGAVYSWGNGLVQNALDLANNRSVSIFDSRHRLNWTLNWELPVGGRRKFLNDAGRLTRTLVSNWMLNALGSYVSGYPFTPFLGDANGLPGGTAASQRIRPDLLPGVPIINPRWSKNVANDVPYFNPEAFWRQPYGQLGDAPRTLDWARTPWRFNLNTSLFRDFRPFENQRRYFQFRAEFFNMLNHATFMTNPNGRNLFGTGVPTSRTGLSLAGPIPYLWGLTNRDFPVGTRENILANNYNQNFGKLWRENNGPGRVVQLALKIYW